MGLMRVPVAALVQGQVFEDWFPLIDTVMKPLKHGAAIRATISFRYCSTLCSNFAIIPEYCILRCPHPASVEPWLYGLPRLERYALHMLLLPFQ